MRVLLIEDDEATARNIELILTREKIKTYATAYGEDGIDLAKLYAYDLVLLDLTLPDITGYEVLHRLRNAKIEAPVIILSGNDETESKLRGFENGADDYITKPFQRDELIARIRAIVRRSQGHAHAKIEVGPIMIDVDRKTVCVSGKAIHVTAKEYEILELLALRKGAMLTKDTILNHLYGGIDEPEEKIIDVFICKLRKKLSAFEDAGRCIETVWAQGYVLRDQQFRSNQEHVA